MAADTRDLQASNPTAQSQQQIASGLPQDGQKTAVYETFDQTSGQLPPSANLHPGGAINTAGGRPKDLSVGEAAKTIQLKDFKTIHQRPCVRDSLLYGICGGFVVGGLRAVLGAPLPRAANWAVGIFVGTSFVTYETCQYQRSRQREGMQKAVEIIDQKKAEKERKLREARAERLEQKESERKERERSRSRWKFW
ncbi:MAG: hypothetical protein M1825_001537 [Sarcosagium campestre]|nr:MAG: hypothetical protein M1825_001537 [Sarcosagium campestre]